MRVSAGILLFRREVGRLEVGRLEVLLAHPGGPFFGGRDLGAWTIPKGEPDPDEALEMAAEREFLEETGIPPGDGARLELGSIVQKGGKVVHAWAIEGNLEPELAHSNDVELEWPPRSGRRQSFPEIDRVAWFTTDEARRRIKEAQVPFIDRLEVALLGT